MSQNIDKRIVEMQFDNKQFESGIQTSVKSLDELKKGLDFDKAVKGLSGLEKAGRSFNLSGISDGVSAISDRFTAMGIVGMRVLQNITDAAYNAGKRMVSALTVDPVKSGFTEYETQIGAIQTILANTSDAMDKAGYSDQQRLDIVNGKLDELNAYADKTIYNFTEMTNNIGKFTAAGVDLDTSVSSIQGIANLAAVSGSTSQQASTAMYQLSQAISTGTVRLMDWNSVVNAGMGGELFQKALMRTADTMGITGDEAQEMFAKLKNGEVSFRDSLASGWLTSDILTSTLGQISMDFEQIAKDNGLLLADGSADIKAAKNLMRSALTSEGYTTEQIEEIIALAETATDAATKVKTVTQLFDTLKESLQSGWTQSWEYIIGDFEEAKELLTGISDYFGAIIGQSADSRNAILSDWKALGGRNELINTFWNIVHSIENVSKVIKGAFTEFFPPTTGQQLFDITKKISDFTAKIKAATENSELMGKVGRVFRGVAAALDIVKTAAGLAWDGFKKLLGMTEGAAGGFLDFIAGIGDWIVSLRDSIKNSKTLQGILDGLGTAAASVRDLLVGGIKKVGAFFTNLWNKVKATGIFTKVGDWFNSFIGKIPEFIGKIKDWGKSIVDWVRNSEMLKTAWNNIKGFFGPIINGIADFGGKLWGAIRSFFGADTSGDRNLWDKIKTRFAVFGEKIGEWFEGIKPRLAEAWQNVKVFVSNLFTKTIPEFFGNLKMKAITKWPWLEKVFAFFEEAWAKMKVFCDPIIDKIKPIGEKLWEAIKNLFGGGKNAPKEGEISFGESLKNFFTNTIPQWFDKLKDFINEGRLKTVLDIIAGIKLLKAIIGVGKLGSGLASIGKGLKGVGRLMKDIGKNGLTITNVFMKKDSFATSLLKVAAAIGILVASIVILANMEAGKAWKGIGLLTLIAGELLLITALFKKIDANGDALLKAAGAVALLVIPIYLLGSMDTGKALKGILGVGLVLTELAIFMKIAGKGGDALLKAAGAVALLVIPIYLLGSMDTGKALKGILGVGLVLTELAIFMKIAGKGMDKKQSFIGLTIAVNLLVFAVKGLGNMDTGAALQGVIGLGAVLLEFSLFMNKTNTKKIRRMISLALAVNLLVLAVKSIGKMNTKTLIKGVLGLGGIMAAFSVLINVSKGMKFGSALPLLLTMAGSMILFVEMFKQVEGMNMDSMLKFAASLATVMLSMSIAMKVISMIPISGALTGLAGFAILVVGVGALITALGWLQSEWGGLTDFLEGGGNILGQIGRALGKFVGGIAGGFVEGLINLPQIGTDLSSFMTNAQGFIDGARKVDGAVMSGAANLAGALLAISGTELLTFLMDALPQLFGQGTSVERFGKDMKGLGEGIGGFIAGIRTLDYDPVTDGEKVESVIEIAKKLTDINSSLGKYQFGDLTKILAGYNSLSVFSVGITDVGTGLSSFITSIQGIVYDPLTDGTKMESVLSIARSLSDLEKAQGEYQFGDLTKILAGYNSLSVFSVGITDVGTGLSSFITSIQGIVYDPLTDGTKMESVLSIARSLSDLEKAQGEYQFGDLTKILAGYNSLSVFSVGITDVGTGLSSFITSIQGIVYDPLTDGTKMESVLSIARSLSDLEKAQGEYQFGDLTKILAGYNSLSVFSVGITDVGTGLSSFITSIQGIVYDPLTDGTKMESVLSIARSLSDLEKAQGEYQFGDLTKILAGYNSLSVFSVGVNSVGVGLSNFMSSIMGLSYDEATDGAAMEAALNIAVKLAELEKGLQGQGFSIDQVINGVRSLDKFGSSIGTVGINIGTFASNVAAVDVDQAKAALLVLDLVRGFTEKLDNTGSIFDAIGKVFSGDSDNTFITASKNMATFGTNFGTFATGISGAAEAATAFTEVSKLLTAFDELGVQLINAEGVFRANLGTQYQEINGRMQPVPAEVTKDRGLGALVESLSGFGDYLMQFQTSIQHLDLGRIKEAYDVVSSFTSMITGLESLGDYDLASVAVNLSDEAVVAVDRTKQKWFDTGANLGRGLANGIGSMAGAIRRSAVNAASGAIHAIRVTWSVHSPSKVGEELGRYWDLGLSGGMDKYANLIDQSSADIGKRAIDTARSVLNNLGYMTDDINPEPTIRPVLDLSDVTTGFQTIDGLFNSQRTMEGNFFGGLTSLRSGRAMMTEQNGVTTKNDNRDIVTELQSLSKRFDDLSSAVSNMQVVLDTGVLVGQTASQMDTQLGTFASRRGRGN